MSAITEPLGTQTTHDRNALVTPGQTPAIEECGFRMLQPHEIKRAMAFPADYKIVGTQKDQVKQLGNAVTPPAMRELVARVIKIFG